MITLEEQQPIIDQITHAFVDTLSKQGEIAIILMYGSRSPKKATAHPSSDVEFIAIMNDPVEGEDGNRFDIRFSYKGIPADIWSTSWVWLEKLAARETLTMVAATSYILGHVVYSRSEKDKTRFEELVKRLEDTDNHRETYLDLARENYWGIRNQLGPLLLARKYQDIEYAREHISHIYVGTAIMLGRINQHLYIDNWGRNLRETFQLEIKPEKLQEGFEILSSSTDFDQIVEVATEVVDSLRKVMIDVQQGRQEEIKYEFMETDEDTALSYLGKMRKAAAEEDLLGIVYAYSDFIRGYKFDLIKDTGLWDKSSIFKLPHEQPDIYTEQGYPDFMSAISQRDFAKIDQMALAMDRKLRENMTLEQFDEENALRHYISKQYQEIVKLHQYKNS